MLLRHLMVTFASVDKLKYRLFECIFSHHRFLKEECEMEHFQLYFHKLFSFFRILTAIYAYCINRAMKAIYYTYKSDIQTKKIRG